MNVDLLGFDGVRSRISELRDKLGVQDQPDTGFAQELSGVGGNLSGLSGSIGQMSGELRPFPVGNGGAELRRTGPTSELKQLITAAAVKAGIDPAVFDALVAKESSYDPRARSRSGAMGLTQLMPATAQSLGVSDPYDPVQNLNGGAQYLADKIRQYGRLDYALAAYNAGSGAVDKFGGIPPYAETQKYVADILAKVGRGLPR